MKKEHVGKRVFRWLVFPFAVAFELLLLVYCWVVGLIFPRHALSVSSWAECTLPDISWYFGEEYDPWP